MNKRQFMAMLDDLSPSVRQAFIVSVQKFATSIPLKEVEAAIAANDTVRLFDLLAYDRGDFSIFDRALAEAMAQGGDAAAAYFAGLAKAAGLNTVRAGFDATNPAATAWLRERSSLLVTEIRNETVENVEALLSAIRRTLEPGTRAGQSVRTTALDIVGRVNRSTGLREGGILGLTPTEAEWAETAYSELVSGDPKQMRNFLSRGTRQKTPRAVKPRSTRFDALVERAIEDGKPLSPDKATRLVNDYRSYLLRTRGERIARTETIAALNEAKSEALDKLIADGIVREQDIELEWDASSDSDTRDSHRAMDGQKRPKGKPFRSGDGNLLLYPGDRSNGAPASDIINCRCFVRDRIDFIAAAAAGLG